ncbi:hypothetical protein HAP94_24130 [Acidithiobacillus ferrivorans]|nr:hypothetical protein [Acidithiobacillus ferrivorans]
MSNVAILRLSYREQFVLNVILSTIKHLITLATAIVGGFFVLSVQQFHVFHFMKNEALIVRLSIITLIISVALGFAAQYTIIGMVARKDKINVYAGNIKWTSMLQIIFFLFGVGFLGFAAF